MKQLIQFGGAQHAPGNYSTKIEILKSGICGVEIAPPFFWGGEGGNMMCHVKTKRATDERRRRMRSGMDPINHNFFPILGRGGRNSGLSFGEEVLLARTTYGEGREGTPFGPPLLLWESSVVVARVQTQPELCKVWVGREKIGSQNMLLAIGKSAKKRDPQFSFWPKLGKVGPFLFFRLGGVRNESFRQLVKGRGRGGREEIRGKEEEEGKKV